MLLYCLLGKDSCVCKVDVEIIFEEKKPEKLSSTKTKKTPVGIQVNQGKKYLYSGIGYPASPVLKCVCGNDDVYEGRNTVSNHVRILSSCWGVKVLLV